MNTRAPSSGKRPRRARVDHGQPRLEAADLDEIRASVDWQAMFSGLGLRKAEHKSKPHDWWAFSPFHEEKTPSFHMAAGGLWYDFSIGEGGGPIELVQRLEGGNCYEAGRAILDRGWASCRSQRLEGRMRLPHRPPKPVSTTCDGTRQAVAGALAEAPEPLNAPIRQDLLKLCTYHPAIAARGISEATCAKLGIGFLPQGRSPLKGRIVFQVADARDSAKDDAPQRVILSHLGRALEGGTDPKYLFYQGFHKSAELYGQEQLILDDEAAAQIRDTGCIVLTEGPFDVAKAVEAGLRNVVGAFGAALSDHQVAALHAIAAAQGASVVRIVFDRDDAGRQGAAKAAAKLRQAQSRTGLTPQVFDWDAPIGRTARGEVKIPSTTGDLADFSVKQLTWLRQRGIL
ncbi:MAG: toprim domain-containing protein [Paracoccaceae bacterium]